jgi:guanylate kinase
MKNLFVIDGASGTGKSDLLHYVKNFNIDASLVMKHTTRSQRDYEKEKGWELDLIFVSEDEFEQLGHDYQYLYAGNKYGFSRTELNDCFSRSANVFVIVRNADVIRKLIADYSFINVVPVFVYTDYERIRERLLSQGVDEHRLRFRLERIEIAFQDYLRHPRIYREVLINNSSIEDYHRLIDLMLTKYKSSPDVDERLVFVLMSFNPDNPNLIDYYKAMKRAVARYDPSLRCISLEEMTGSFRISDTAKENIRNCRLAIVDLTESKPNVYYELGYVHGIAKSCIITAHVDTPKLFYPGEYKIVYYRNASELEDRLSRELKGGLGASIVTS